MGGGMVVFRLVAATDVAACHADPQVHPGISGCEAFLAAGGGGLDIFDLFRCVQVVGIEISGVEAGGRSTDNSLQA